MVRSETELVKPLGTEFLFSWFLDNDLARTALEQTAFTHSRPRLKWHDMLDAFFDCVVRRAMSAGLTGDEHFSLDGARV